MTVQAKFYVTQITQYSGRDGGGEVKLAPVIRGKVNADWSKYTPSGELTMQITNPAAFDQFAEAINDDDPPEFLVTFERAEITPVD